MKDISKLTHQKYKSLEGDARTKKINQLKSALIKQMNIFTNHKTELERLTSASYDVAKLIAVYKKLFTDGEYVKECIMTVVKSLCPQKTKLFSNFCLQGQ